MMISTLLSYYWRFLVRNPKPYFYFITSLIVYFLLMGILVFLQSINEPSFYRHELLSIAYLFQFFYGHLYYGLGWESSFRYFEVYHIKMKNILYLYIFMNLLCFIFSFVIMKLVSLTTWLTISYSVFNIIIVYLLIPNLLFVFIFPLLTIHIDLFSSKGGLVIHNYFVFLLYVLVIAIPAMLQYLWLNFFYGPELIASLTVLLALIVTIRFPQIVKFWEAKLLQVKPE